METIETLSKSIATYQILKDLRNSDHFKVALKQPKKSPKVEVN